MLGVVQPPFCYVQVDLSENQVILPEFYGLCAFYLFTFFGPHFNLHLCPISALDIS